MKPKSFNNIRYEFETRALHNAWTKANEDTDSPFSLSPFIEITTYFNPKEVTMVRSPMTIFAGNDEYDAFDHTVAATIGGETHVWLFKTRKDADDVFKLLISCLESE